MTIVDPFFKGTFGSNEDSFLTSFILISVADFKLKWGISTRVKILLYPISRPKRSISNISIVAFFYWDATNFVWPSF